MNLNIEERETIKEIFRDVIHEVLLEERIKFYDNIIPFASKEEIKEIEDLYGSPDNYKKEDFVNMTNWINN